ncbi:ferric-dicitrate binding protein FerR (iron transport regulator) [Parabacteroides sp. PF5-5]|uniref:FecR domain-containing protein n=1 Tax=unclassified Parabacteroides TaxID=2649774 RepID=UPI0024754D0F|nr:MULTISPECIES: FecR domain-containing protein [unclassified Parabacteroides]MDH6304805.1 ferric-dicitrate binding protein FerR (iron transport regulator) [Parabacteroides sp. PH5-39]MDH6315581.1 ferric-dicitrate binding protein FerR (iron transport regulator) [Parabacteroides sp. PF5-13]MDH6319241.1 ferric-dicitrate binding protein FerR (iron transport regulator) [Parabacteroides sp. PH5-13]MDH6322972.1 ferric-dicitrate binding protein FerR (iron transport regulator) [Parabacteroides sp. PH5-
MTISEDILIKYIDNTLSVEEKASVEAWLATSPENRKILEQMYFTMQLTERLKVMKAVDVDKAFAQFKKKKDDERQKGKFSLGALRLGLQRIAAILIIPLLVLTGYLLLRTDGERMQMVEMTTSPGVVSTFNLPDGSKVWLNGGSSLKYASNFGKENRFVELSGESYFKVAKDANKPFIVSVNPSYKVKVLGTSFNVSAYEEDDIIETTLIEGSVNIEIQSENGKNTICQLKPSERAEFQKSDKRLDVKKVNTDAGIGWVNGEIVFRQEPMTKVLKTLGRHYNVQFEVKDPEVMDAVITARFKDEELTQVMEYLKVASGIKFKYKQLENENEITKMPVIEIYR